MAQVEMTLTEALAKRATILKRMENWMSTDEQNYIQSESKQMIFCKKKCDSKIGSLTVDQAMKQAQSTFDQMFADLNNYTALTMAINEANVANRVQIGSRTMTIAAAIVYKSNVVMKMNKSINNIITKQIQNVDRAMVNYNNKQNSSDLLNQFLSVSLGEEGRSSEKEKELIEMFHNTNDAEVVDPLKLREKSQAMKKELEEFQTEVDTVLSIANATIKIKVDYVD